MSTNMSGSVDSGAAQQTYNGEMSGTQLSWQQLNANSDNQRRQIRANATSLTDGEWERLDETVYPVLRENLVLVNALEGAGLTTDITMAHTESTWQVSDDLTDAEFTMDARTRSEEDIHTFGKQGVPIPMIHKDYRIGQRELEASRNMGTGLDTMMSRTAARKVSEAMEDLVLNGIPDLKIQSQGNLLDLPGLRNYNDRIQMTGDPWSDPSNVVNDLNDAVYQLEDNNWLSGGTGFWMLMGTEQKGQFRNDYETGADAGTKSVAQRVDQITEIDQTLHVPRMPAGEVVIFKPVPEVIDLARDPTGPQNIQWDTHGGFENHFKVLSLMAPRIKSTYDGNCGIVHITGLSA